MAEYATLDDVFNELAKSLDSSTKKAKPLILFANNGTGKTRLSKMFSEKYENEVLCYNAFVEDSFTWDNENYILKLDDSWIKDFIQEQGIDSKIVDNFKRLTNSKIEPRFASSFEEVVFYTSNTSSDERYNIKISKGEESIFIWSVFQAILQETIDALSENRPTHYFDNLKYIIIDDPVSSMDDSRIIETALIIRHLVGFIDKNIEDKPKILITTHHPLFFNCLYRYYKPNKNDKYRNTFVLSKTGETFDLIEQNGSSFAYHHTIISEIKRAIENNSVEKYHFNLFRCLLEKTANFLGYPGGWFSLLEKENHDFANILNEYSHDQVSEVESRYMNENHKELFRLSFDGFLKKYNWRQEQNDIL